MKFADFSEYCLDEAVKKGAARSEVMQRIEGEHLVLTWYETVYDQPTKIGRLLGQEPLPSAKMGCRQRMLFDLPEPVVVLPNPPWLEVKYSFEAMMPGTLFKSEAAAILADYLPALRICEREANS